jgi:glycosyltransferase involved in cell wall biosynthesis
MIFSVIVPFLNEELFIEDCIHSLLNQKFDKYRYELIFIDNGSIDRSTEIIRKYTTIKLLHEPRRDPYLARNRGIETAQGQYLAFTDADCLIDDYWLAELQHGLEGLNADIVLGRLLYPSPTSIFVKGYEHYYHTKIAYLFQHKIRQCYYGHAGNMAIRASVFDAVGLFSGMPIVGDTEIIHKLLQQDPNATIGYAPRAQVVHAEVRHFGQCLYKLFECGQHSETYGKCSHYRPLHFGERFQVLKTCLADSQYDSGEILTLAGTLLLGYLSFAAGRGVRRLHAMFSHGPRAR